MLGTVLDSDPVTVSRRWRRLVDAGAAWIACYPIGEPICTGIIEVTCAAGSTAQVAETVAEDTQAVTVAHVAASWNLLIIVMTTNLATFSDYVVGRVGQIEGVVATRSYPVSRMFRDGSMWDFGSIDAAQRSMLEAAQAPSAEPNAPIHWRPWDATDQSIALAMAHDGRITHTKLAATTNASVNTVRRRVASLVASRRLVLRCELQRTHSSWPVPAIVLARIGASHVRSAGEYLASLRATRMCATVASGPHNLIASVSVRSVLDLEALEVQLARDLPDLTITDRAVVMRPVKVMGNVLDVDGSRTHTVPIDLWTSA